jgi:hypothetical protein
LSATSQGKKVRDAQLHSLNAVHLMLSGYQRQTSGCDEMEITLSLFGDSLPLGGKAPFLGIVIVMCALAGTIEFLFSLASYI